MAAYQNNNDSGDLFSWIVTLILLVSPAWPIGLVVLFRKLMGKSGSSRRTRHPYDLQREGGAAPGSQGMGPAQGGTQSRYRRSTPPTGEPGMSYAAGGRRGKPVKLGWGKGLTVVGIILMAIFGLGLVTSFPFMLMDEGLWPALALCSPIAAFFGGGAAMTWVGRQRTKKAKRYRKYLALIGKRDSVSITTLAEAMPTSVHKACEDLQDMLDSGVLPTGYLDMGTGRLILSDEGIPEEAPAPPEPEMEAEEDGEDGDELDMNDDDAVLAEIRRVNDAIADEEMSRKIDRIGEITSKIFAYQKQNPGKAGQLRSFLSYYLPTTLKILRAYAQLEDQEVSGSNITAAMQRIEGMMDKVVEGFEKQLDLLFQGDAMDIATDVEVLERMLAKDGLSDQQGLTLGL